MKREKLIPIIIVIAVVVIIAAAGVYFAAKPALWQQALVELEISEPDVGGLAASGFIEAEEVSVAPEWGGRVLELLVDEGNEVESEQVLARLDTALLEAQIEAARAALDMAQARLDRVEAGARVEQIQQAKAGLAQAEAARDGAYQAWQDTIAIRDNPQELNARIIQAQAQVNASESALNQAVAMKDAAVIAHDSYWNAKEMLNEAEEKLNEIPEPYRPSLPGLSLDTNLIPNQYWKAWVGVNSAGAAYDGARAALNDLYAMRNNPQELNKQVDAAEAQYRAAEAAVQQAQAQLDAVQSGATKEEIAVVKAQVEQAQAALDALMTMRDKLTITAPVGGLVLECNIHEGELSAPGGTLLTLGDLDKVTLTVYVPEDELGSVKIGQQVEVQVDSFPEQTFTGKVIDIASEAEFTPRNVQTQEERVNMVFAVDVQIPNSDHVLKPGVPADAVIITQEQ